MGFQIPLGSNGPPRYFVNSSGLAAGTADRYVLANSKGRSAVRWNSLGTATELGNLGTNAGGITSSAFFNLNSSGVAVGYSEKYIAGTDVGERAVRWEVAGTTATELGNLGTDGTGYTAAEAYSLNDLGTAVGYSAKYFAGSYLGSRAVRWDASGTAATELGNIGTDASGSTGAYAYAVNNAGTAVGGANKYVAGSDVGYRAVRWDASGTATELGSLGTAASGVTDAHPYALNDAGTAVGYVAKYVAGVFAGDRAVRWDALGTAATELGNLGASASGTTSANANTINTAGTSVGWSEKYVLGKDVGARAVRWSASGTLATELANLGTDANGITSASAISVNDAGVAVGSARKYVGGNLVGNRAVIWLPDASVIDLNDLGVLANPPDGTWLLTEADAISNNGWVAGVGQFTPTGGAPYSRGWVAHVSLAVPEPGGLRLAILAVIGWGMLWTRRADSRRASHC